MDFHSILSIAQQKQQVAEKQKPQQWGLSTKFSAPKKAQKSKEIKSDVVKKLLQEKEREKRDKEKAKRDKAREAEKAKRFRIPKADVKSRRGSAGGDENGTGQNVKEEEVVIHKEDFVKSSSKKRMAHNPVFSRPPVTPVKEEPEPIKSRSKSSSDISTKSERSSHKQSSSKPSKSESNIQSSSGHSSKSSSKVKLSTSSDKHSSTNNGHKKSLNGHKSSLPEGKALAKVADKYKMTKAEGSTKPAPKPKVKPKPGPPPMQFDQLLKLAEQKHKEPVKIEAPKAKVKKEETAMRTQQEIDRVERVKSKTYQDWLKFGNSSTSPEDLKKRAEKYLKKQPEPSVKNAKPNVSRSDLDIRKSNSEVGKSKSYPEVHRSEVAKRKLIPGDPKGERPSKVPKLSSDKGDQRRNSAGIVSKVNLKEKLRTKSADNSGLAGRPEDKKLTHKPALPQKSQSHSGLDRRKGAPGAEREKTQSGAYRTKAESGLDRNKGAPGDERGRSLSAVHRTKTESGLDRRKGTPGNERGRSLSAVHRTKTESGLDRRKGAPGGERGRAQSASGGRKAPSYASTHENVLVCGPPKPEPTKALNPFDRIYNQIQKNRPIPAKRQLDDDFLDSEEEDWSDEDDDFIDDDFIDDGPATGEDYSSHLKEVFGYSYKDRFRDFDDRDTNMVSSFAQQMKEEARSTRLGKLEDLEDMRKEEEELRRKKLAKKKKAR